MTIAVFGLELMYCFGEEYTNLIKKFIDEFLENYDDKTDFISMGSVGVEQYFIKTANKKGFRTIIASTIDFYKFTSYVDLFICEPNKKNLVDFLTNISDKILIISNNYPHKRLDYILDVSLKKNKKIMVYNVNEKEKNIYNKSKK